MGSGDQIHGGGIVPSHAAHVALGGRGDVDQLVRPVVDVPKTSWPVYRALRRMARTAESAHPGPLRCELRSWIVLRGRQDAVGVEAPGDRGVARTGEPLLRRSGERPKRYRDRARGD